MYCPICNAHDRPTKGSPFVVYGSTRKRYMQRIAEWYGVIGFTPHLITFEQPLKTKGNDVQITFSCGVCEIIYDYIDSQPVFVIKGSHKIWLPKKDFNALLFDCKDLGYTI